MSQILSRSSLGRKGNDGVYIGGGFSSFSFLSSLDWVECSGYDGGCEGEGSVCLYILLLMLLDG